MILIRLITRYMVDFVCANVALAIQLLSPRMRIDPQTIELPTRVERPLEVLALSNLITFTPGTLALDIEPGKKLTVHVLRGGQKAGEQIRDRLEQPLLQITRGRP